MYVSAQAQSIATALLDGGWTSEDAEEIQREYGFSGEELAQVIECMARNERPYVVTCVSEYGYAITTQTFDDFDEAREFFNSRCANGDLSEIRLRDRTGKLDDLVSKSEVA